jgi:predicted metalloprotease with PDZ domain
MPKAVRLRGTQDLSLESVLSDFGVVMSNKRKESKLTLGIRTAREANDCKVASVFEGGVAHQAGLSAGDVLVALDGLRVTASNLDTLLNRYRNGDTISVQAFRRDELMRFTVVAKPDSAPQFALEAQAKPLAAARMRSAWLRPDQ